MNKADTNLLITIAVMLLLVIGIGIFGINTLWSRFGRLQAEQDKTAKELSELEARVDTLAQLAKDQFAVENLGRRALAYLPTTMAEGEFLMDLAAMGGISGTNIPTVSFQESDTKKSGAIALTEYPITMTVEGQFEQLKTFLGNLENNLRFSAFSSMTMSLQQTGLSLQLTGTIFSKAEDKNPKDRSLEITDKMERLLTERRQFGSPIDTGGPGRANPFLGI